MFKCFHQPRRGERQSPHTYRVMETRFNIPEDDHCQDRFRVSLKEAYIMWTQLKRPKDKDICENFLKKCGQLMKCKNVEVQKHVLIFFEYFIKVLKYTRDNQPYDVYYSWYSNNSLQDSGIHRGWFHDNQCFVAVRRRGSSMVVYSASSNTPNAKWHNGGLVSYVEEKQKLQKVLRIQENDNARTKSSSNIPDRNKENVEECIRENFEESKVIKNSTPSQGNSRTSLSLFSALSKIID